MLTLLWTVNQKLFHFSKSLSSLKTGFVSLALLELEKVPITDYKGGPQENVLTHPTRDAGVFKGLVNDSMLLALLSSRHT